MSEVSEVLRGEGLTRTQEKVRVQCDLCLEPAIYRHTFLLEGTRSNPASSAYGRDDCSWCSDSEGFSCEDCARESAVPGEGYVSGSRYQVGERFAHMFLMWVTVTDKSS